MPPFQRVRKDWDKRTHLRMRKDARVQGFRHSPRTRPCPRWLVFLLAVENVQARTPRLRLEGAAKRSQALAPYNVVKRADMRHSIRFLECLCGWRREPVMAANNIELLEQWYPEFHGQAEQENIEHHQAAGVVRWLRRRRVKR